MVQGGRRRQNLGQEPAVVRLRCAHANLTAQRVPPARPFAGAALVPCAGHVSMVRDRRDCISLRGMRFPAAHGPPLSYVFLSSREHAKLTHSPWFPGLFALR